MIVMPYEEARNQFTSFNIKSIDYSAKGNRRWIWMLVIGVIFIIILGSSGYFWFRNKSTSDSQNNPISILKIQPLAPKVTKENMVPVDFSAKLFLFNSEASSSSETIEIISMGDFARVKGASKLYYNRNDGKAIFLNGALETKDMANKRMVVVWENNKLQLSFDEKLEMKSAVSGKDITWDELESGKLIQVVAQADEDGKIIVKSILLL